MKPIRASATVFVAALLVAAPAAFAKSSYLAYQSKASGSWDNIATWEVSETGNTWRAASRADGLPTRYSRVRIQAGHNVLLSTEATIFSLKIQRGDEKVAPGTLSIGDGGWLTVRVEMHMQPDKANHARSARIEFTGTGDQPGVLHALRRMDIHGVVEVTGCAGGILQTERSSIPIAVSPKAEIRTTCGPLTISGSIEMDGLVVAEGPHRITVTGSGPRIGSSGLWRVEDPRAVLRFETSRDVHMRAGRIVVERGLLDVASNLRVSGSVVNKRGRINVDPRFALDVQRIRSK